MSGDGWITIKGDGTDRLPPIGHLFKAMMRNGNVWTELAVTKFCLTVEGGPFRHYGGEWDPMAYQMNDLAPPPSKGIG